MEILEHSSSNQIIIIIITGIFKVA